MSFPKANVHPSPPPDGFVWADGAHWAYWDPKLTWWVRTRKLTYACERPTGDIYAWYEKDRLWVRVYSAAERGSLLIQGYLFPL